MARPWVGKERALKPFLPLFISLDQKVGLIPELRFPIATLLNEKKAMFLPPVDLFEKELIHLASAGGIFKLGEKGLKLVDLGRTDS